jgi:hypothetical protein
MNISEILLLGLFAAASFYAGYIFWKTGSFKGRDPYDKDTWKK